MRAPDMRSASCAVMQVTDFFAFGAAGFRSAPGRIHVVVPEGDAVLQATYDEDGQSRRAVVRPPALCVVPAESPCRIWAEKPCRVLVVALDAAFHAGRASAAFGAQRAVEPGFAVEDGFLSGLAGSLANALGDEARAPSQQHLEAIAATLALHLASHHLAMVEAAPAAAGLAAHKLQRVLAVIDQRLTEAIQVKELAQAIHMSPFHFARMFKLATGLPPHAYITRQRMERAKALLGSTDLALADVASRVGYQTQAHFTGVFHRHVGVTPRVYRRGCRREGAMPAATASAPMPAVRVAPAAVDNRAEQAG